MYKNFITLSGIIARLLKNPLMDDMSEDDAVESALDCISLIGTESMFVDTVGSIVIEDFRGAIPQDASTIDSVRFVVNGNKVASSSDPTVSEYSDGDITYKVTDSLASKIGDSGYYEREFLPMRPASGPFHLSQIDSKIGLEDLTYSIKGNFIYTSFESGMIEIAYKTLATQENGELIIPDDINVIKAIENYIKMQYYQPLWEMGKISDKVFNKIDQDYCWYVAKAQTSTREMSLDEREAMASMNTTLINNRDNRGEFYGNLTAQEFRTRHRS